MRQIFVVLLGILLLSLPALPGSAAEPGTEPVRVSISAPVGRAGSTVEARVAVADTAAVGLAGVAVGLDRWDGTTWQRVAALTTDTAGVATIQILVSKEPARNRLRAVFVGDASHAAGSGEHQIELARWTTTLSLSAPATVIDERKVHLKVRWLARDGQPV